MKKVKTFVSGILYQISITDLIPANAMEWIVEAALSCGVGDDWLADEVERVASLFFVGLKKLTFSIPVSKAKIFDTISGLSDWANRTNGWINNVELMKVSLDINFGKADSRTANRLYEAAKAAIFASPIELVDGQNRKTFRFYTITPSQGKTNEATFASEDTLASPGYNALLEAGTSIEAINAHGGWTSNKFLQARALGLSGCEAADSFGLSELDIRNVVIVDDVTTEVAEPRMMWLDNTTGLPTGSQNKHSVAISDGLLIFVSPDEVINRKGEKVRFKHYAAQVRAGIGGKGLLITVLYSEIVKLYGDKFTDVYGEQHTIREGIILAFASAVKNYKFFNNCEAWQRASTIGTHTKLGVCAFWGEDFVPEKKALSGQTLSSLWAADDALLGKLQKRTIGELEDQRDGHNMLALLAGSEDRAEYRSNSEQLYATYPNMVRSAMAKLDAQDKRTSMIFKAKAGRLKVNGGYYPAAGDPIVCLSKAFGKSTEWALKRSPLKAWKCFQRSLKADSEVTILRNPHLFFEHLLMNTSKSDLARAWYQAPCAFFSGADVATLVLGMDFDGDTVLISQDEGLSDAIKSCVKRFDAGWIDYLHCKAKNEKLAQLGSEEFALQAALMSEFGRRSDRIGVTSIECANAWSQLSPNSDVEGKAFLKTVQDLKVLAMAANLFVDASKTGSMTLSRNVLRRLDKTYSGSPLFRAYRTCNKFHSLETELEKNADAYLLEGSGIGDRSARALSEKIQETWTLSNPDDFANPDYKHLTMVLPKGKKFVLPRQGKITERLYSRIQKYCDIEAQLDKQENWKAEHDGRESSAYSLWIKLQNRNANWTIVEVVKLLSCVGAAFWNGLASESDNENDSEDRTAYVDMMERFYRLFVSDFMLAANDTHFEIVDGKKMVSFNGKIFPDIYKAEFAAFNWAAETVARQGMKNLETAGAQQAIYQKFYVKVFGGVWADNVQRRIDAGEAVLSQVPHIASSDAVEFDFDGDWLSGLQIPDEDLN